MQLLFKSLIHLLTILSLQPGQRMLASAPSHFITNFLAHSSPKNSLNLMQVQSGNTSTPIRVCESVSFKKATASHMDSVLHSFVSVCSNNLGAILSVVKIKSFLGFIVTVLFWCHLAMAWAVPQGRDTLSGSRNVDYYSVENNTTASVTLVPAVAGQIVTLYKLIVSTQTADNIYLQCGATAKTGKKYLGASSGADLQFYPFYLQCNSGEALNLIKGSATTPVSVDLWYSQLP